MKSKIVEKILFVLLFSALSLFVACGSSDENKDLTDSDADTSDTDITDSDSNDTTSDNGDSTDDSADTTQEVTDTTPDGADSTDDSDQPAGDTDTDTDTEPTESTEPTNPTEPEPTDEPDPEFEQNAEGCTMIEVPKITVGGAYADEVDGYFSPAMGDVNIDYIHIYLYNRVEGEYELGTGKNATFANCSECVTVTVDEAEAVANEYYFQASGTLKITKVVTVDEIERTSGEIRNLILKQAEPVDHFEDMEFIDNGKCVAVRIVEWDTTGEPGY